MRISDKLSVNSRAQTFDCLILVYCKKHFSESKPKMNAGIQENKTRTAFISKEISVIEEIVNVLLKPTKYEISEKDMFTVFNSSSSMLESIINGPSLLEPENTEIDGKVSTKMVDFQNLVSLGQILADKRNVIKTTPDATTDAVINIKGIYKTLSTHVYINHVKMPAATAAVMAAAAASSSSPDGPLSWWNVIQRSKPIATSLDPRSKKLVESREGSDTSIASSTNPLESADYFPDLRLVLKNVLLLFISFFKRYEELIKNIKTLKEEDRELIKSLRDLMLLLNISILNKLVEIFKMLNPKIALNSERKMYEILS